MSRVVESLVETAGLADLYDKVVREERLTFDDGVRLFESRALMAVGAMANMVRERKNGDAAFFVRNPAIVVLAALAVLATSMYALATKRRGAFVVAAAIIVLTYPHLWLVWTGDALEVTRHSLLASVMLRIGIWLGALWLLDSFLTDRRHHDSNGTASAMMPTATMPSSQ